MLESYVLVIIAFVVLTLIGILVMVVSLLTLKQSGSDLSDVETFNRECNVETIRDPARKKRCESFCNSGVVPNTEICQYTMCSVLPKFVSMCSPCADDFQSPECQASVVEYCKHNKLKCVNKCVSSSTCGLEFCKNFGNLTCSDTSVALTYKYNNSEYVHLSNNNEFLSFDSPGIRPFYHLSSEYSGDMRMSTEPMKWGLVRDGLNVAIIPFDFPTHSLHADGRVSQGHAHTWLIVSRDHSVYLRNRNSDKEWLGPSGVSSEEFAWDISAFGKSSNPHFVDISNYDFPLNTATPSTVYVDDSSLNIGSGRRDSHVYVDHESVTRVEDGVWFKYIGFLKTNTGSFGVVPSGVCTSMSVSDNSDHFVSVYQNFWKGSVSILDGSDNLKFGMCENALRWSDNQIEFI